MSELEELYKKTGRELAGYLELILPQISDDWCENIVLSGNNIPRSKKEIIKGEKCSSLGDLDMAALLKIIIYGGSFEEILEHEKFDHEDKAVFFQMLTKVRPKIQGHYPVNNKTDPDDALDFLRTIEKFLKMIKANESLISEAEKLSIPLYDEAKRNKENINIEEEVVITKEEVKSILTKRYRIRDLKGLRDDSNEDIDPYSDNYVDPIYYGDPETDPLVWYMDDKIHKQDMCKFINFFKQDSDNAEIFKGIHIFKALTPSNYEVRVIASNNNVLLDSPSKKTGLKILVESSKIFDKEGDESPYYLIDSIYEDLDVPYEDFVSFAETLGVACKLSDIFVEDTTYIDDEYICDDYTSDLGLILKCNQNSLLSKLVWDYFIETDEDCKLFYKIKRKKEAGMIDLSRRKNGISSLMESLKETKWVPQIVNTGFLFVKPKKARPELLPPDLLFGNDPTWLEIIGCDACKNLRG